MTYPTFFPSPPEALKTKDETAWYFYLAEIALTRLKNRILSFLYRSGTSAAPADSGMEFTILDFEEQMDAWYVAVDETANRSGLCLADIIPRHVGYAHCRGRWSWASTALPESNTKRYDLFSMAISWTAKKSCTGNTL